MYMYCAACIYIYILIHTFGSSVKRKAKRTCSVLGGVEGAQQTHHQHTLCLFRVRSCLRVHLHVCVSVCEYARIYVWSLCMDVGVVPSGVSFDHVHVWHASCKPHSYTHAYALSLQCGILAAAREPV